MSTNNLNSLVSRPSNINLTNQYNDNDEKDLSIESLPDEIFVIIFSNLNPRDLAKVSLVSKRFCILASNNGIWKKIAERFHFFSLPPKIKPGKVKTTLIKISSGLIKDLKIYLDIDDDERIKTALIDSDYVTAYPKLLEQAVQTCREEEDGPILLSKALFTEDRDIVITAIDSGAVLDKNAFLEALNTKDPELIELALQVGVEPYVKHGNVKGLSKLLKLTYKIGKNHTELKNKIINILKNCCIKSKKTEEEKSIALFHFNQIIFERLVESGNLKELQTFLKNEFKKDKPFETSKIFNKAIRSKNLDMLYFVINEFGANPKNTSYAYSIETKSEEIVKLTYKIVKEKGISISEKCYSKAIKTGKLNIINLVQEHTKESESHQKYSFSNALKLSILTNNYTFIKEAFKIGLIPSWKDVEYAFKNKKTDPKVFNLILQVATANDKKPDCFDILNAITKKNLNLLILQASTLNSFLELETKICKKALRVSIETNNIAYLELALKLGARPDKKCYEIVENLKTEPKNADILKEILKLDAFQKTSLQKISECSIQ